MSKLNNKFQLRFRVDSKILRELGENLIARPSIALAELVKNSFDADATKVTIEFKDITKRNGIIIVDDNGEGITRERLEDTWMTVSTTDKIKNPISKKYKRVKTGEKGIGRFACQAIAKTLVIETIALYEDGKKRKIEGTFYWDKFDLGVEIVDVPIDFTIRDVHPQARTGTRLILYKLNKKWSEVEVKKLNKELLGLISPFDEKFYYKGGFEIFFKIPEFKKYSGKLSQQIIQKAWGELIGRVTENGVISYQLKTDSGDFDISLTNNKTKIGEASFKLYVYFLPRGTSRIIRAAIEEIGGVRIFVDGFRVFSYGQPEDDWLDLDKDVARRLAATPVEFSHLKADRPLLRLPPKKHLVGGAFLSRIRNPNYIQTVNRDRLLDNDAFQELRYFIRKGIEWATIKYAQIYEQRQREKRISDQELRTDSVESILYYISKTVSDTKPVLETQIGTKETENLVESISNLETMIKERESDYIDKLSILRLLASVGTTVFIFEHEIDWIIENLNEVYQKFNSIKESIESTKLDVYMQGLQDIRDWQKDTEKLANLTVLIDRESNQSKSRMSYKSVIADVVKAFEGYFRKTKIIFRNDLDELLRSPRMFRWELYSIFLNLLTNSTKALLDPNNKKTERIIRVWGKEIDNKNHIFFEDNGVGIPKENLERVFEPFFSTSNPDIELGKGIGLGLTIVKDIIEEYSGIITFDEHYTKGARAKIKIPRK